MRIDRKHVECWDLIPWLVNGRASDEDEQSVRAHLAECKECRDEFERQQRLRSRMQGSDSVISAPQASWQRFLARIEADALQAGLHEDRYRFPRRWMLAALAVQSAAILVLLTFALGVWQTPARYTTLSAPAVQIAQGAAVRIVFAPDASVEQVNRTLHDLEADVVAGPSEAGVYTLRLAGSDTSDLQEVLSALRQQPNVLFAEPLDESGR